MLVGTVAEDVKRILTDIAKEKGFDIREMAVGEDDVHVFITAPPHVSISSLVKWVQGISARHMFMKQPGLKKKLYKGHLEPELLRRHRRGDQGKYGQALY
jgi:putative transposase